MLLYNHKEREINRPAGWSVNPIERMAKKMILELSTNNIGDCVGVDPRDIALVYGERIFAYTSFFGDWEALVDAEDLEKSKPSIYHETTYRLGNIKYFPYREEYSPHHETRCDFIEVSWTNGTEYDSHCTLCPLQGYTVLKVKEVQES